MIPYIFWLPPFVSLVLSVVYWIWGDGSPAAKLAVAMVFLLALVLQFGVAQVLASVVGLVLQVGLGVYLSLYLKVSG